MVSINIIKDDGSLKSLEEIEKEVLMIGLETHEQIADLARQLGISRSTLYRKIEYYELETFIEKAREKFGNKIIDEKATIRGAMLKVTSADELCKTLNMDRSTLTKKLKLHGLIFMPRKISYSERIAVERRRYEAEGSLYVRC